MITMSRIISSPFLTYAIINDMKYTALIGCCVFGFTDWLDGYVAKNYNQMSVLGAFLDPVADKVLIGALSIGLCYKGLIPLGLASVIIGRDVLLVAGSFILRARERPSGSPFFDTTYSATFEIAPSTLSKVNTGFQFLLLASTIGNFGLGIPTISYIEPLWWITAVTTIGSGIGYLDGTGVRRLSKSGIGRLGKKLDEYEKKKQQ
jgi:cardiolipin synthase